LDHSSDLFRIAHKERRLKELGLPSVMGSPRYVYIRYPEASSDMRRHPDAHIKLPILDFKHPDLHPYQLFILIDYYEYQEEWVRDDHRAISWDSLPSAEELLRCYSFSCPTDFRFTGPFRGLLTAVKAFADRYCNMSVQLPLVRVLLHIFCDEQS